MFYKEITYDLFKVPEEYYLVHCISADFALGAGIAVEFNKHFNMKAKLQTKYPKYLNTWDLTLCPIDYYGDCILEGRVFNLITKQRYFHKPTYKTLEKALIRCRGLIKEHNIKKIAMPVIGCGLDRLNWTQVSKLIQHVFRNEDIQIIVCKRG